MVEDAVVHRRHVGYLCPVCLVRFPYSEKLAEHWSKFHCKFKDDLRTYPSLASAARRQREQKYRLVSSAVSSTSSLAPAKTKVFGPAPPPNSRKRQHTVVVLHDFQRRTVNEHVPHICQICDQMIWHHANFCRDCGYVCHLECHHMNITNCGSKMQLPTKTDGESTSNEHIGEIRPCQSSSLHIKRSAPANNRKKDGMAESTDLDLTYITDRLIAMTYPASGQEAEYRTKLLAALKHLQSKHVENFRIINVSERRYDILQLNEPGQVVDYGWPDHLAPPLDKISQIINSIHYWLECDIRNVAVIHCKGGKSRIGLVIASYVQFSKNSPSPQGALDWFALRRYYDKTLDGAMHPSQKRYVGYYGDVLEKRLKTKNLPLLFQNLIFHGVPLYGNGGGLRFRMKIYQGYHLVHTTKTFFIPSDCDRFSVTFDENVQLSGDIMLKCIEQGSISQNVIFRLQFNSDSVDSSVALFGKYDLDEAFTDYRFPDSSHVELIFAPTGKFAGQHGIFEKESEMTSTTVNMNQKSPGYLPGPLDGSPYAQIDPSLKERLRMRAAQNEVSLQRGIEDLDGLLGDLGYTNSTPDYNGNTYRSNSKITTSSPKYQKTLSMEGNITPETTNMVNNAPPSYRRMESNGSSADDVFTSGRSASITVNDLLFELDHSPLNSSNSLKRGAYKKKANASVYDNDLEEDSSDVISDNSRNDSVDGEMEIRPGIVAQHIKTLNKVLYQDSEVTEYNQKYGVPMAGVNAPELVEQKVTAFNSRSVAPGYCSPPPNQIYHSQGSMTKVEYKHHHEEDHSPLLTDEENADYTSRMESLLSRSDSAYGESMRSSSPSPAVTPSSVTSQRSRDGYQDNNNNVTKQHEELASNGYANRYHWQQEDEGIGKGDYHGDQYEHHSSNNYPRNHVTSKEQEHAHHHRQHNHHVSFNAQIANARDNEDGGKAPTLQNGQQPVNHQYQVKTMSNHNNVRQVPIKTTAPSTHAQVHHQPMEATHPNHHQPRVETNYPSHHQSRIEATHLNHHQPRVEATYPNHLNHDQQRVQATQELNFHQRRDETSYLNHHQQRLDATHLNHHQQPRVDATSNHPSAYQQQEQSTATKPLLVNGSMDVVDTPVSNVQLEALPNKDQLLLQQMGRNTNVTTSKQRTTNKRTLTVVEEQILPAQVQKEVECMNEDIFKNLIDDDLLKPTPEVYRMPTSSHVRPQNERLTSSSTEDEVHTEPQRQHQVINGGGSFKTNSQPAMPVPYEAAISPPSTRRFPPLMAALQSKESTDLHHAFHLLEQSQHQQQHHHTRTRTLSNGSSTTSDDATSPRSPCGSGLNTLRHRRFRSSGSSNSSISSGELFPEVVKYPSIKFHKDTMNLWYKPNITRDEATNILRDSGPGVFVVRDSQSYEGAFGLAVKVACPPPSVLQQVNGDITKLNLDSELVRHFLIEPCKKGVRLKGSNDEPAFPSLVALIYQHSLTKMALPIPLVIPELDSVDGPRNGIRASGLSESQLLEKGAACNLVYLGAVKVDTLTGDGAVQYSMNKVTSPSIQLKTTTVNIKVNQQGITLTDNNRRMFFRRHFPMCDVIHCGVDPKNRKVNLKALVENHDREVGCFGVVVKKQANSPEHHCHMFAELETDQPTSAVINFIHKAMRYARV